MEKVFYRIGNNRFQTHKLHRLAITQTTHLDHKSDIPDYPTRTINILRTLSVTSTDQLLVWHSLTSRQDLASKIIYLGYLYIQASMLGVLPSPFLNIRFPSFGSLCLLSHLVSLVPPVNTLHAFSNSKHTLFLTSLTYSFHL